MMRLRAGVAYLTAWTDVTVGLAASIEFPIVAIERAGFSVEPGITSSRLVALCSVLIAPFVISIVVVSARWSLEQFEGPDQRRSWSRFSLSTLLLAVVAIGAATWVAIADYRGLWLMDLPRLIWLALPWFVLNCLRRYLDTKTRLNAAEGGGRTEV